MKNGNASRLRQLWFSLQEHDMNITKARECVEQILRAVSKDPMILTQISPGLTSEKIQAGLKMAAIRRARRLVGYLTANAAHLQSIYVRQDIGEIRSIIEKEQVSYGEIGTTKGRIDNLASHGHQENDC